MTFKVVDLLPGRGPCVARGGGGWPGAGVGGLRRVAVWRGGSFLSQPPMKLLVEAGGRSTSGRVRQGPSARPFGIGSRRGRAGQAPSCSLQPRGKPALPSTCAARDKRPGNRGGLEKHRCWSFPRKAAVTSNKRKHSVSPKIQFRSRRRGQRRAQRAEASVEPQAGLRRRRPAHRSVGRARRSGLRPGRMRAARDAAASTAVPVLVQF